MHRIVTTCRDTAWTIRTIVLAYLAIGGGLLLQPNRFSATPSYANLVALLSSQTWGCLYLAVSALMIAWRIVQPVWLGVIAHTLALMLTLFWLFAFVIRYQTDNGTTIVNVVSWAVFLSLVTRSVTGQIRDILAATKAKAPADTPVA